MCAAIFYQSMGTAPLEQSITVYQLVCWMLLDFWNQILQSIKNSNPQFRLLKYARDNLLIFCQRIVLCLVYNRYPLAALIKCYSWPFQNCCIVWSRHLITSSKCNSLPGKTHPIDASYWKKCNLDCSVDLRLRRNSQILENNKICILSNRRIYISDEKLEAWSLKGREKEKKRKR